MSTTKLITMYGSPWSERVRWALKFKGLAYGEREARSRASMKKKSRN